MQDNKEALLLKSKITQKIDGLNLPYSRLTDGLKGIANTSDDLAEILNDLNKLEQEITQIREERGPTTATKFIPFVSWAISIGATVSLPTAAYKATDSEVFQHSSWLAVLLLVLSFAIHVNCKTLEESRSRPLVEQAVNDWMTQRTPPQNNQLA